MVDRLTEYVFSWIDTQKEKVPALKPLIEMVVGEREKLKEPGFFPGSEFHIKAENSGPAERWKVDQINPPCLLIGREIGNDVLSLGNAQVAADIMSSKTRGSRPIARITNPNGGGKYIVFGYQKRGDRSLKDRFQPSFQLLNRKEDVAQIAGSSTAWASSEPVINLDQISVDDNGREMLSAAHAKILETNQAINQYLTGDRDWKSTFFGGFGIIILSGALGAGGMVSSAVLLTTLMLRQAASGYSGLKKAKTLLTDADIKRSATFFIK